MLDPERLAPEIRAQPVDADAGEDGGRLPVPAGLHGLEPTLQIRHVARRLLVRVASRLTCVEPVETAAHRGEVRAPAGLLERSERSVEARPG